MMLLPCPWNLDPAAGTILSALKGQDRFMSQSHEDMTKLLLSWLAEHGTPITTERAVKIAIVSATFSLLCSPPNAHSEHLDLAAKYCALFFAVDDAETDLITAHRRYLEQLISSNSTATPTNAFDTLLTDIANTPSSPGTSAHPFVGAWLKTCSAMERERTSRGHMSTLEELLKVRQDSIAVHPYVHLWYFMNGIELTTDELTATESLRRLVAEQIILCNDLVSIDSDIQEGSTEPNYVLLLWREQNLPSLGAAIDHVVARYNRQLQELARERDALVGPLRSSRVQKIVQLTLMSVNGNIETSRQMARVRYGEFALERLDYLPP